MGGPPMGGPPRAAVVRRGTSKAVPIVVSAGLAVGVFCGLLFGLGTGESAVASPSTSSSSSTAATTPDVPKGFNVPPSPVTPSVPNQPTKPATGAAAGSGSGSAETTTAAGSGGAAPAAGSGSGSSAPATASSDAGSGAQPADPGAKTTEAGAGSGSAAKPAAGSAEPAIVKAKVTVEITPAEAASAAKITLDGAELTSNIGEITLDKGPKKKVKLSVKATGYRSVDQKIDVDGDLTVKIDMVKRPAGPAPLPRPKTPKAPSGGGGLIDI